MVRLAVRKTVSRGTRSSVKRKGIMSLRNAPSKTNSKKKQVNKSSHSQLELAKAKTLLNSIEGFIENRKESYGVSDSVAKRMQTIHNTLKREFKKKNFINPMSAKCINQINPALRGVSNVPQSLRKNTENLKKFMKTHAHSEVEKFNIQMKKMLLPAVNELKKLEKELVKEVTKARNMNALPRVNPILKQRFNSLMRQFVTFRTYWLKHFNKLRLHGTKTIQASINQIKSLLDEKQREFNRNLTILNRYAKNIHHAAEAKTHQIFTPTFIKGLEWKWNQMSNETDKYKKEMNRYFEQLRIAKNF